MSSNNDEYRLALITDPIDQDFISILSEYKISTDKDLVVPTDTMCYWMDDSIKIDFDVKVFGFYRNDEIIGLTQYFWSKVKIVLLDFVFIRESERNWNTLKIFKQLVLDHIESKVDYDFLVTEIVYKCDGKEPTSFTKMLLRSVKAFDFSEIQAPYYIPVEEPMEARLMIYNRPMRRTTINKITFLEIITVIYHKYYFDNVKPLIPVGLHQNLMGRLDRILTQIEQTTPDVITING